jgi:hypothetical protein
MHISASIKMNPAGKNYLFFDAPLIVFCSPAPFGQKRRKP